MRWLTNGAASELSTPVANVSAFRDRIVDAIDWLFLPSEAARYSAANLALVGLRCCTLGITSFDRSSRE